MVRKTFLILAVGFAAVLTGAGSLLAVGPMRSSGDPIAAAGPAADQTAATSRPEPGRPLAHPFEGAPSDDDAAGGDPGGGPSGRPTDTDATVAAPLPPTRVVTPRTGTAPAAPPLHPIGDLDDHRPVPAGLAVPAPRQSQQPSAPAHGGPTGLAVEASCSHQCISRGVAYPRGFGAELIVETTVPAKLFISAVADLDGDGSYEYSEATSTPYAVDGHSWALDHLDPGQTYHVMAAATDEDGHTAYVWGEFTTLSKRDVFVVFGDGEVVGGPDDITETRWYLGLDGPPTNVTPGEQGILLYQDVPRHVDVDFWMLRSWDEDLCEAWVIDGAPPHGHDSSSCLAWNSAQLDAVDLDRIPEGARHWTETSVAVSLHPPTGAGDALPPGYGDPYYFSFEVPMTLAVTYS